MLHQMMQTHFVDRVAATLGEPPAGRDWPGDLAARFEGHSLDAPVLQAAADHLVNHGGKTFPGFGRCYSALRAAVARRLPSVETPAGAPAPGYHEAAKTYIERHGGRCYEISPDNPETASAYQAWRVYFAGVDVPFLMSMTDRLATITVPARLPWEFDPTAPRSFNEAAPGVGWSEEAAINFAARKECGRDALRDGWALGLISFIRKHHRAPTSREAVALAAGASAAKEAAEYAIRYGTRAKVFGTALLAKRRATEIALAGQGA